MEAVAQAASIANADRFIARFPEGYDHQIQERGAGLSTGEKQLLAFSRALAFDPSLEIAGQVVIGRAHVGELGGPQRPAVARGDLEEVEDVQERDGPGLGHIGVRVLTGVFEADGGV